MSGQEFRGGFRRGGRRGGGGRAGAYGRGGRGRGRGPRQQDKPAEAERRDVPAEKSLPQFTKIKDIKAVNKSWDLIVKVGEVKLDSTRNERRRGGRTISMKCSEALVGDETGCLSLSTRQQEIAALLKEGEVVVLLNVKMRRVGDLSWLDVDNWSAVKPLDACKELLPEGFNAEFELNRANDRSKKTQPKPNFVEVLSLEPEQKGLYLVVKVVSVTIDDRPRLDGTTTKVASAVVGDDGACIVLIARGEHIDVLQKDAVLVVFNAHIEMYDKGFMRLVVDRWSDMKPLENVPRDILPDYYVNSRSTVNVSNNRSQLEWELQEDADVP